MVGDFDFCQVIMWTDPDRITLIVLLVGVVFDKRRLFGSLAAREDVYVIHVQILGARDSMLVVKHLILAAVIYEEILPHL